ncbi:hypothetical protein GKZ89_07605 [Bacillus mangrovi]|uniref:Uncharacterized protein n=1 Tax=Metabacillus mangrovi TaxID=1491830 RepID=A0A7X2V419_9BACI|nr:hypothetical protein [Metabacillus mangrovi]MTH53277.1 hypothetical protein [Metabacillus mangrovi]
MLIQSIIAFASKALSKLFSFATASFLGRVPSRDDSKVSFIGVVSFYWLLVLITFIFPLATRSLIPFAPDNQIAVRIIAAALLAGIPLLNGWVTTRVENYSREKRPYWKQILMGYPITIIMGFLVVSLVISIPIMKAPYFIHRYYLDTIKIMIKKEKFEDAFDQIKEILESCQIREEKPPKLLQWQFKFLTWVHSEIFHMPMSREMRVIKGEDYGQYFQIILYAHDIAITSDRKTATKLRSILAEELNEENLYFSWDEPSHEVEDAILDCKKRIQNGEKLNPGVFSELAEKIKHTGLSQEEWNSIRRQIYKLEAHYYTQSKQPIGAPEKEPPDYLMAAGPDPLGFRERTT